MIDTPLRKSLSQDLRRLITGRMTNDAFDDRFHETYNLSDDDTVRCIAAFGWSLYSSDLPLAYRLRGRYAVDQETRTAAARSVLFLRSGRGYEWPPTPRSPYVTGVSLFIGIPIGAALSFLWLFVFIDGWETVVGSCAVLGTIIFTASVFGFFYRPPLTDEQRGYAAAGDLDVWPFLHRADFDEARKNCHLLGRPLQ